MFNDDWYAGLSPRERRWFDITCEARRNLEEAERLYAAAARLCKRAEAANIRHPEVDHDPLPAKEQIERDEANRERERQIGRARAFADQIEKAFDELRLAIKSLEDEEPGRARERLPFMAARFGP